MLEFPIKNLFHYWQTFEQADSLFVLRVFSWRRTFVIWNLRICWFMRLANHPTFIKLSKLTIRRRNRNNSLGCTIFQKYYTSILLATGIVKMKVPNIFLGVDFSRSTNSLIFLLRIHILRAYNCIRNCLGIFQSGCFQQWKTGARLLVENS